MNNSLYFNFYSGVSGDMLLGSLIDLGIDINISSTCFKGNPEKTKENKRIHIVEFA